MWDLLIFSGGVRFKKQVIVLITLSLFPISAVALDCDGYITEVYSWPSRCDGFYAYKLDNSNGRWICSASDKGDALVLLAYSTNTQIRTRIAAGGDACANLSTDWLVHDFIRAF